MIEKSIFTTASSALHDINIVTSLQLIDDWFFPDNFQFDRFSYEIDYRSNSIYHFEKIETL